MELRRRLWKVRDRLAAFLAARAGATAVEFGFVALPFLAIVCATLEIGYVHLSQEMLSAAVAQAARQMAIGTVQANAQVTTATSFIQTYLCPANNRLLPISFDCSRLAVDVRAVTALGTADLSNDIYKSNANVFCPGQPGSVVIMRVTYPLRSLFPLNLFNPSVGLANDVPGASGWFHILLGSAVFMEEPYGTYTAGAGC